jgi:IS30 family transposase
MGRTYQHFSLEERCQVAQLQAQGQSLRQIAATLDRAPSSVAREVKRNAAAKLGYRPSYAQQQSQARRWRGSKLDRDDHLRQLVLSRLAVGWSPEQVAGRLRRETGQTVISYETIYRFIAAQMVRTKDYAWRQLLPRGHVKRGLRRRARTSAALCIAQRRPLAERPAVVADRMTPGHWEADLMLFARYGQAVLTVHDRQSRLLLALRPATKPAQPIPCPQKTLGRAAAPMAPDGDL